MTSKPVKMEDLIDRRVALSAIMMRLKDLYDMLDTSASILFMASSAYTEASKTKECDELFKQAHKADSELRRAIWELDKKLYDERGEASKELARRLEK